MTRSQIRCKVRAIFLTSFPILRHYDTMAPVEIHTSAIEVSIGAVLDQRAEGDPMGHVVRFASHTLSKAGKNYTTPEK